ncbi:hypothetical protein FRA_25c01520 [Francisella sp. W12-1067]|nr:hypothetical protein FRA_25c01520 [Francisella sp. W12-1067]
MAASKDEFPGLYIALQQHGHATAITAYINAINSISGINTAKKIELLAAKNKDKFPGLYAALREGHAAAVTAYINAINSISGINTAKKIELLAAKNKDKFPGLYAALRKGHAAAVTAYIKAINSISDISLAKKIKLLAAKDKDKFPGLYIALQNGHADTVAVYLKINDHDNSYANYIMQEYKGSRKIFKNQLLKWAQNYKPEKMKKKEDYSLLISLLSFNRNFISNNLTKSMKVLNNIPHWQ